MGVFSFFKNKSCVGIVSFILSFLTAPSSSNAQQIVSLSPNLSPREFLANPSPISSAILSTTISEAGQLAWGVKTQQEGDYYKYYLQSVTYQNSGNILWQFPLPERISNRAFWGTKEPVDIRNYYGFPFLIGTIITAEAVFIADDSGILVIDKETGNLLVDKPADPSPDSFFVDWGRATIITSTQRCETPVKGGKIFTKCGEYLVYFNGENLWVWHPSGQLLDYINYSHKEHDIETHESLNYQIRISLKTVIVEIRGFVGE